MDIRIVLVSAGVFGGVLLAGGVAANRSLEGRPGQADSLPPLVEGTAAVAPEAVTPAETAEATTAPQPAALSAAVTPVITPSRVDDDDDDDYEDDHDDDDRSGSSGHGSGRGSEDD